MKAIKRDKAVAIITCGTILAATAGLVVNGLNKSDKIAQTANVETFVEVDSKEMSSVLSIERLDNILVGATLEGFYGGTLVNGNTAKSVQEEPATETTTEQETEVQPETQAETQPETETPTEEPYAYADFFLVNVDEYLNVRTEGSENGQIVGKLYAGTGGTVLERGAEWSYIQSGNVEGFVKNEYVWFAHDAEANIPNVCPLIATSNVDSLRLRKGPGTDYGIQTTINTGTAMKVMAEEGDWVAVSYDGIQGYTAKEYVTIQYEIGTGITIEEEQAAIEAERARIAEEKARLAEEAAAAEQARLQEQKKAVVAETVQTSAYTMSTDDTYLLACLVMSEAGSECYEGKLAVANIVLNRLNSGKYGNTISDVIYASGQFSVVRNGALDRAISNGPNSGSIQAAQEALAGVNNVPNYTSFCTKAVAKYGRYQEYSIIGNQVFYR